MIKYSIHLTDKDEFDNLNKRLLVDKVITLTTLERWFVYSCLVVVNDTDHEVKVRVNDLCQYHSKGNRLNYVTLHMPPQTVMYVPTWIYCDDINKYCHWFDNWMAFNSELPTDIKEVREPWLYYDTTGGGDLCLQS